MNFRIMLFASMLSLLFVPAALAQQMDHGSGHGQESGETADAPSWTLTPEQQEQVQSLHAALQEETEPLKRKLTARKLELRAALLADTPEHERIDALVAEINTINSEIFSRHVSMQVEMSRQGIYAPFMTGTAAKGSGGGMMHGGKMGMKGMKGGRSGGMGMMHGKKSGGSGMGMMGMCPKMQGMHGAGKTMQHGAAATPAPGQHDMLDGPQPDEGTAHQGHQMQ